MWTRLVSVFSLSISVLFCWSNNVCTFIFGTGVSVSFECTDLTYHVLCFDYVSYLCSVCTPVNRDLVDEVKSRQTSVGWVWCQFPCSMFWLCNHLFCLCVETICFQSNSMKFFFLFRILIAFLFTMYFCLSVCHMFTSKHELS